MDQNGEVEAADALLTLQAATQKINLTGVSAKAADVDGSGTIDSADALQILQYATKKIGGFSR